MTNGADNQQLDEDLLPSLPQLPEQDSLIDFNRQPTFHQPEDRP